MQGPSTHFPTYMGPNFSGKMHTNSLDFEDHINGPHNFQQKMVSIYFPASTEPNCWQTPSKIPHTYGDYMCGTQIFQHKTILVMHVFLILSRSPAHVPSSYT